MKESKSGIASAKPTSRERLHHPIYVYRPQSRRRSKRSDEGRDYLSLKLDDPSFNAPIYANLFDDEGGEGYTLLWSRPRKNGE